MVSQKEIEDFLHGEDPEEYIVALEYDYPTNKVYKVIQHPTQGKVIKSDTLIPFAWIGSLKGLNFYKNSAALQKQAMSEHGILIEKLETRGDRRLEQGLNYLVKSTKSYSNLVNFFKNGGLDPWGKTTSDKVMILPPVEQYLVQKGKRLFKGFNEYDEIHRFVFDIETTGLDPKSSSIFLIGMKDNRGFEKVLSAENEEEERQLICDFFDTINYLKPTLVGGYNSAFFDFPFIMKRAELLKLDIKKIAKTLNPKYSIKTKDGILKLANEMEPYTQTMMWGYNIIDIAHAVRRAQGINSDIKSWGLKYITQFIGAEKENRVYVQGDKIGKIYFEDKDYYFNPKTGKYREVGFPGTENLLERFPDVYEVVKGSYLIERYLYDDIWETMVVDESFNQANFLLSKLVPTTYERLSTMGTATLWKMIMASWSYKNKLAIPKKNEKRPFTGGLSRLLQVGYSKNVLKLDYSSLYPSIQLVHDVFPKCDVTGAMKSMLKYFRDTRIKYKKLAEEYSKSDPKLSSEYSRKQLPIKIFINAFFGSLSAPHVFPWGDMDMGEQITCTGRQYLRQMIMWFMKRDYQPLVMDSVEYDTPVYLIDKMGDLMILPISDIFDEESKYKTSDNLRDFSEKEYKVLTKNGWQPINYVYRHGTTKTIHKLVTKDRLVNCTSDHSVFQDGVQIKPTNLNRGNKIDIVEIPRMNVIDTMSLEMANLIGFFIGDGSSTYRDRGQTYKNKKGIIKKYRNMSGNFTLNNSNLDILKKYQEVLKKEFGVDSNIYDTRKSSSVYKLQTSNAEICKWFSKNCYTSYRQKMIPKEILNGSNDIMKSFLDGFYLADGYGDDFNNPIDITQKSKVCLAGIVYMLKQLGVNYKIQIRKDKPNIQTIVLGHKRNGKWYGINDTKSKRKSDEIWNNVEMENKERYVYDISTADGTFVGGIGGVLLKNTDGVNFATPEGRESYSYIGKGLNGLVEKDKQYFGAEADVAEYNDLFMRDEMGLDIDGIWPATINVARKNYALLTDKGKVKLTGNTIKSKKLPTYVVEFLDKGLRLLLDGKGSEFLDFYYEYVELIYNKQIPIAKIANKARVKQSVNDYKTHITKKTKSGSFMSRQAHMELVIANNLKVGLGDTIYYVNNGQKKSHGDVQKQKDGVAINCYLIDEKEIERNPDMLGDYNVSRYLAAFNKRIEPLLVVFHPDIRHDILIEDPTERVFFTKKQTELVRGFPDNEKSQDTLEEVLTLSESEIDFWLNVGIDPYYMYLENTIDLVDIEYVEKNKKIMDGIEKTNVKSELETIDEELSYLYGLLKD